MANKPSYTVEEQIALLKQRGMLFQNEPQAADLLKNISYYRLKGYWWDMQEDVILHNLKPNTNFEDIIDRYNFDRHLRLILFDAIERIEIALRTKLIYHLSIAYGGLWYLDASLFENKTATFNNTTISVYESTINELQKEFGRSQEIFIKDQRNRYPNQNPDAWKILEIASMGTLSKLYKNLKHQLPEKAIIAKEMGLNLATELSSWLEAITYVRNIIAHHSRLWSRSMVKTPIERINNPIGLWYHNRILQVQTKKPFLIISCMIYLCNHISPNHHIKIKIIELFKANPSIPIYKLGFVHNWSNEPFWATTQK